jgi:hypothetical protein
LFLFLWVGNSINQKQPKRNTEIRY